MIARWFKDPKFSVSYPSGPLIRLTTEEFRSKGLVLIRGFCEEYERVRMDELDAVPMFDQQDVHKVLKNYIPVSLFRDHVGQLTVAPLRFRKYDLGGLVSLGPETFRKLSWDCSEKVFLDAFDAVLEEAG